MEESAARAAIQPQEPGRLHRAGPTGHSTILDPEQDRAWKEKNLLSLDGGGIRGYWTLLVLERLMLAIGDEERRAEAQSPIDGGHVRENLHSFLPEELPDNVTQCDTRRIIDIPGWDAYRFLPCHYFDVICGSSTGSLIAIMLSRFRMTVKDCLDEYERMSHRIFGNPRIISQRNILIGWPKYSASAMEHAFKEVTRRRAAQPERVAAERHTHLEPQFPTTARTCSMFATTILRTKGGTAGSSRSLYLLRSYAHENSRRYPREETLPIVNFGAAEMMQIWQVARAATAAPFYFREISFRPNGTRDNHERSYYSDGGFGSTNNPTAVGIHEIELLHGDEAIGAIVSIGTAKADNANGGQSTRAHVERAFDTSTNPRDVHISVLRQRRPHYWRLNDEEGLNMPLDDWKPYLFTNRPGHKTMQEMRNKFAIWAGERANVRRFEACAKELVRRRRARTGYGPRWELFATGISEFRCIHRRCCDDVFNRRDKFDEHWEQQHEDEEDGGNCQVPAVTRWIYQARPPSRSAT